MADDDLDLSEFEEFSETAARARGKGGAEGSGATGGTGGGGGRRKRRRWPWLLAGLVLGALGALFGPDLAAPYLPSLLRPSLEEVAGPVLGKRSEGERLLLTVNTERGAVLATFRQRVAEIDLLVEEGDTVTLGVDGYAPLMEDPLLRAVKKGASRSGPGPPGDSPAGADPEAGPAEETESPDSAPGDAARDTAES